MEDRITITEAAEILGKHRNTVRGWIRGGKLRSAVLEADAAGGAVWRIDRTEIEALAPDKPAEVGESRTEEEPSPPAPTPPESPRTVPEGYELVPAATFARLVDIAAAYGEAGERVGRAEATAEVYRERLEAARLEAVELRAERDRLREALAAQGKPTPPAPESSAAAGVVRRLRDRWQNRGK